RLADPADAPQVESLIADLEGEPCAQPAFAEVFAHNLAQPWVRYWVAQAVADGPLLGFISLHAQALLHHQAWVAEVQELVVVPLGRGQGLGRQLLATARQQALAWGCANLEVTCNQKRLATHRFYEQNGLARTHFKFVEKLPPPPAGLDTGLGH
nr:GNAT family N-acetyltransferase [Bernardetiaceae bacterium]